MILDATTKKLQAVMSEAITTNDIPYIVSYSDITTTAFTPISSNGTTNGTTPVDIVAAPAGSTQRNIQYFCIANTDTVAHIVTINYNNNATTRQCCKFTLQVGDVLQYTIKKGWIVKTNKGIDKPGDFQAPGMSSYIPNRFLDVNNVTGSNTVSNGNLTACVLGTATKVSSSINIVYRVTGAISAVTWAEIAVYKQINNQWTDNVFYGCLSTTALQFLGYADTSAVWTGTGIFNTTITLTTPTAVGDLLWVVFGDNATGTLQLRAGLAPENDLWYIAFSEVASSSLRPSTANKVSVGCIAGASGTIWCKGYLN